MPGCVCGGGAHGDGGCDEAIGDLIVDRVVYGRHGPAEPVSTMADITTSKVRVPTRRVLSDDVYEAVKEYLIEDWAEPGAKIVIDRLAADLGVSPTPVREALARLEADRLIVKEPHRGYTVAPRLDSAGFLEMFEMRLVTEPVAAALAATRAGADDLRAMSDALERIRRSKGGVRYREYRQMLEGDAAFHAAVARASRNRFLLETITRLATHQIAARLYVNRGVPDRAQSRVEHLAILEALGAGDAKASERLMRRHLSRARDELHSLLYGSPRD